MKRCGGCDAPMFWCRMVTSGKAMPLDPGHADTGTVYIDEAGGGHAVRADDPRIPRYVPHWVTCPVRQKFKRKQRRE